MIMFPHSHGRTFVFVFILLVILIQFITQRNTMRMSQPPFKEAHRLSIDATDVEHRRTVSKYDTLQLSFKKLHGSLINAPAEEMQELATKIPQRSIVRKSDALQETYTEVHQSSADTKNETQQQMKTILLYNNFFSVTNWSLPLGSELFTSLRCPIRNCQITKDRSLLNESDAVWVHGEDLPMPPPKRSPHQSWIFFDMESPQPYKLQAYRRR